MALKNWIIDLRVDFATPEQEAFMLDEVRTHAKQLLVQARLLADKRKPDIAIQGEDTYEGRDQSSCSRQRRKKSMASSNYVPVKEWMAPYMPQPPFPLLGFPNETNLAVGEVVYQCRFGHPHKFARIALWKRTKGPATPKGGYGVNLYHVHTSNGTLTHAQDRYSYNQGPIIVEDAFEAQLAINYLIQKHLPEEVINDIYRGLEVQDPQAADCHGAGQASGG